MIDKILNARLLDPTKQAIHSDDQSYDINIIAGKISDISISHPNSNFGKNVQNTSSESYIDAKEKLVFAGLVDLATYLREPGASYKASIKSETYAAASAGITTLCFQPEPRVLVNNTANVNLIHEINQRTATAHIEVIGNLTQDLKGEALSNMGDLKQANCVGVSNGLQPLKDLHTLHMAMKYASTHDLKVFIHPLEHSLAQKGCVHAGSVATRVGLPSIPEAAESAALAQALTLVEATGAKTHFCRLSSAASVKLIEYGKKQGLPITADVAAHQLFLTDIDIMHFNPLCHTYPPLRSERDKNALRQGLADGVIDAICSDHQPHEIDAKLAPFQQTEIGISGLETLLPLTLKLVEEGVFDLSHALKLISVNPAKILNIDAGQLRCGSNADLVIFDPDAFWCLEAESMLSDGKNTPFLGQWFSGEVINTLLAGKMVYSKN
jgi:dihydroorotase